MRTTALNQQNKDESLARSIQKYIEYLKNQSPETAQREASEALRQTGITTEDRKARAKSFLGSDHFVAKDK